MDLHPTSSSELMYKPRLSGKVAIITGGTGAIGEQAVKLFAENGAFVVAVGTQDEVGHQIVASVGSEKVSFYHCDVRDEKQVEEMVNFTIQEYGSLDILFSNAAIVGPLAGVLKFDSEGFDNAMAVNVRGVALTMKHAGRAMVERKIRGSIICTASASATIAGVGPHVYTTSKHALVGLAKTACGELGAYGIRVNCVAPLGVATPLACRAYNLSPSELEESACTMANLKGIVLKARHIAEAALFLASDESAYISGQNLVVDGGYTVVSSKSNAVV